MRILSITNDGDLSNLLRAVLVEHGFHVTAGSTADVSRETSLILVDERLVPGFTQLRRLRTTSAVPVIALLRQSGSDARSVSLEAGADDCLGIPFSNRELAARVRALLRRTVLAAKRLLEANGVQMDTASREVFCDGEPVDLTTYEYEVLEVLLRSAGTLVSRDQLSSTLYNRKATSYDRSIDMHVSHLRKKLAQSRTLIKTVRGVGYQFCLAAGDEPQATARWSKMARGMASG